MSYEKQTWNTGDIITATKLNHIEDGIANVILIVNSIYDEDTEIEALDKTWQEIADAIFAVVKQNDGGMFSYNPVAAIGVAQGKYFISIVDGIENVNFSCSAPNECPIYDGSDISPK